MVKAEAVVKYYVLCNKLKNVIRQGWIDWNVKKERLESVAEHIFGVQMLAIAMHSEFQYNIDIQKVIYMLAIHELEEIVIGDLTLFQISKDEKDNLGYDAVIKLLDGLVNKDEIINYIVEFNECKTSEAIFANQCDKLECDLQCKLYDEEGCVDLQSQEGNTTLNNSLVQELLSKGCSWSEMWMEFGQRKYNYDEDFMEVSNYAKTHKIKL